MQLIRSEMQVLKQFDELVIDSLEQSHILKKQNQKLAQARDVLLPKLMSGEIEV